MERNELINKLKVPKNTGSYKRWMVLLLKRRSIFMLNQIRIFTKELARTNREIKFYEKKKAKAYIEKKAQKK
jgi:hypothetical protein